MLLSLFILALPALLSAAPPRVALDAAADALTMKKIATEKRLIKTRPDAPAQWMTDAQILELYKTKTRFMDLTYTQEFEHAFAKPSIKAMAIPTAPTHQAIVNPIIANANTALMKSVLPALSAYNNRYYRASTGAQSATWLFGRVQKVVTDSHTKLNVTVTQFKHSWGQHSIIARIEGKNGNQETVIVGAHQDSINANSPMSGRAPGSDDDGSGTVTILEAFRLILASSFTPTRPVEFHWYAGEEAGLLGSQAIAQAYSQQGRQVAGMMQFDMTMYPNKQNPDAGLVTDYTDDSLNALVRQLITTYTPLQSGDFECGYACSDHASWNQHGYPSTIPFESSNMDENTMLHTPQDDLTTVNYDHGLHFTKIAVGFIVELAV